MTCKLARCENEEVKIYTCKEVKELSNIWKKEFRDNNGTDKILESGKVDFYYQNFCKEIDDFLDQCNCIVITKMNECKKCNFDADYYNDGFCKCVKGNIERAKYERKLKYGN